MFPHAKLAIVVIGAVAPLFTSSCTKRIPEPANVAPGTPYVTWVLMYGDWNNADQEFACQSDPRTACALPASRPDAQIFSDIHFYYHGTGAETRYEGDKVIEYLQGAPTSRSSHTKITLQKDESITNESITGIVTSTAGTYTVTLSLTATMPGTGKIQPVRETIQVVVK